MKASYLDSKAGPDALVLGDIPQPSPKTGEALIKIHATAVMPTEFDWFTTFKTPAGEPRPFPIVLSHEFSGVIELLGANVNGMKIGDEVYGLNDWFVNGAQAEYCVAPASALARKPKSLSHAQSAVAPISALTAWQALFSRANLQSGQCVLIHGASGGVGTFAVQLAHRHAAHVIATTSSANVTFTKSLGADEVIDYRATRFDEQVKNIDVVFDVVGGDTLERSWKVLRPGGRLITIVSQNAQTPQRNRDAFMLVQADGSQLAQIGRMIDAGELKVFTDAEFPLAKTRDAYAYAKQGGKRGKVAVRVAE